MTTTARQTLTERRKAETRREIADEAMRLFLEDGYEAVAVDAIARASGVSLRTFYRYFATKEEVLGPIVTYGMEGFADHLASRPVGEPLGIAVRAAFGEVVPIRDETKIVPIVRLLTEVPALRARWLEALHAIETRLAPVVADRAAEPLTAVQAQLTAGTILLALRVALERTVLDDTGVPFFVLLEEALSHLDAGATR